ncbi:MAG: hypothetical protein DI622_22975, partial [Chryseobacterium sp.]
MPTIFYLGFDCCTLISPVRFLRHSHHFQNAMLCLEHNKPVLCEKALTVNAAQTKILYETAKKKNLFFMEAVWTRYFPLSIAVRKHITSGDIGEVLRVTSDLSIGADK